MAISIGTRVALNNGVQMPVFGLGTWSAKGRAVRQAVLWALEAGYRLIDTAASYGNEDEVGEAIRESGLAREEIFVTTKVWPSDFGSERTMRAFESSSRKLGLGPVDLFLLHWPGDDRPAREESWKALEALLAQGRCRAIGVSNYDVPELEEILGGGGAVPAVNQVLYSPFTPQRKVRRLCREKGIRLEGYSPLTRGEKFDDPVVRSIASAQGRSPAQVLLRWALQKDVTVIPKSVHRERIRENAEVFAFELTAKDVRALDGLAGGESFES